MKLSVIALLALACLGCSAAYKAPVSVAKVPIVAAITVAKTPVTVTKAVINSEKPKPKQAQKPDPKKDAKKQPKK
jgi:PBP1b-binding outer membrane lipoprotein LpoB